MYKVKAFTIRVEVRWETVRLMMSDAFAPLLTTSTTCMLSAIIIILQHKLLSFVLPSAKYTHAPLDIISISTRAYPSTRVLVLEGGVLRIPLAYS